jgi:6-pyruvoyl tetrahydropterin synthase
MNPTAENMANYLCYAAQRELDQKKPDLKGKVVMIRLYETPTCSAEYCP